MKIHLTLAKTLDGVFLQPTSFQTEAKSIIGALQEYSYRTNTQWRSTDYGWYRQVGALAHMHLSETDTIPPLPKIRCFDIEEYMRVNDEVDYTYLVWHKIFALSEAEAVAALRQKTKARNARLNLPASDFVRTYKSGWLSKYIKLVIEENHAT